MLKEIEVKIISDSAKATILKFIQVFVVFKNFSEINNFPSYYIRPFYPQINWLFYTVGILVFKKC